MVETRGYVLEVKELGCFQWKGHIWLGCSWAALKPMYSSDSLYNYTVKLYLYFLFETSQFLHFLLNWTFLESLFSPESILGHWKRTANFFWEYIFVWYYLFVQWKWHLNEAMKMDPCPTKKISPDPSAITLSHSTRFV